jgi:MFS family permease
LAREHEYSQMLSATGFGALAAALMVARFGSLARQRLFLGSGLSVVGAGLVALSFAANVLPAVVCCVLVGFGLILFFATNQAVVQLSTAEHNRGLIMGIWAMLLTGAVPLGNLLAGPGADRFGEPLVLRVQGIACGLTLAGLLLLFRLTGSVAHREGSG